MVNGASLLLLDFSSIIKGSGFIGDEWAMVIGPRFLGLCMTPDTQLSHLVNMDSQGHSVVIMYHSGGSLFLVEQIIHRDCDGRALNNNWKCNSMVTTMSEWCLSESMEHFSLLKHNSPGVRGELYKVDYTASNCRWSLCMKLTSSRVNWKKIIPTIIIAV